MPVWRVSHTEASWVFVRLHPWGSTQFEKKKFETASSQLSPMRNALFIQDNCWLSGSGRRLLPLNSLDRINGSLGRSRLPRPQGDLGRFRQTEQRRRSCRAGHWHRPRRGGVGVQSPQCGKAMESQGKFKVQPDSQTATHSSLRVFRKSFSICEIKNPQ